MTAKTELHPALQPVAWLIGTWRGEGTGVYPTIDPFRYGEEVTFADFGRPALAYSQRTWALADGEPLHRESGFWRPQQDGKLEVVLAHTFGAVEIQEGVIDGHRIELTSKSIALTSTAKRIDQVTRTFELSDDALTYSLDMAAVGEPLQIHLRAELRRA
jgi:hypothetical protein